MIRGDARQRRSERRQRRSLPDRRKQPRLPGVLRAPESIATSDGRPTNAIYGFAAMMVKVLTDFRPRAVVVAWDAGWSGREKVYEPYKAQRKSRPDLLKEQWPHLAPLSEAFGFANVRIEGWEADDVIASMTHKARREGSR
jgi:DNA polymerase-1